MLDPALEILRRGIEQLGLPLRSVEIELGPSQCEFTFRPQAGLAAPTPWCCFARRQSRSPAATAILRASCAARRLPNVMSSGWHLHQSLLEAKSGRNAFAFDHADVLSTVGRYYLGGLLAHARAAAAFTTPTINGYKRYRPYSLAPDRAIWATRQSRRDDPRARPARRSRDPSGKSRRRACGQSLSLCGFADLFRARRHCTQARSGPFRRHAL